MQSSDAAYLSLAAQLHHYPLAISQAGAFLNQRRDVQLTDVHRTVRVQPAAAGKCCQLGTFAETSRGTASPSPSSHPSTPSLAMLNRWGMEPVGHAVLTACAYLHSDAIPLALLQRVAAARAQRGGRCHP